MDFRPVADGHIKVLLAECKLQPPPELQSNSSFAYDQDRQGCIINADSDDLKDIVLSTVAEELASMVACSGDQLENIARNHNAGLDEEEMSYVLYYSFQFRCLFSNFYEIPWHFGKIKEYNINGMKI